MNATRELISWLLDGGPSIRGQIMRDLVLEGLRDWLETTPNYAPRNDVLAAERRALDFALEHRLFKSDKAGKIIDYRFTVRSYPHRWYDNVLGGLACFARMQAPRVVGIPCERCGSYGGGRIRAARVPLSLRLRATHA